MCYWIENMAEQALKKKIKLRNTAVKSVDKIVKESQTIILTFEADKLFNERIIALRDTMLEKVNRVKELDADIIDLIEDEERERCIFIVASLTNLQGYTLSIVSRRGHGLSGRL